jgi:hypothetical protein
MIFTEVEQPKSKEMPERYSANNLKNSAKDMPSYNWAEIKQRRLGI